MPSQSRFDLLRSSLDQGWMSTSFAGNDLFLLEQHLHQGVHVCLAQMAVGWHVVLGHFVAIYHVGLGAEDALAQVVRGTAGGTCIRGILDALPGNATHMVVGWAKLAGGMGGVQLMANAAVLLLVDPQSLVDQCLRGRVVTSFGS